MRTRISKASLQNCVMLLAIYAMHMLFVEVLMAAPSENHAAHFSKTLIGNQTGQKNNHASRTDYRLLVKHDEVKQSAGYSAIQPCAQTFPIFFLSAGSALFRGQMASFPLRLSDSFYKRYSKLRVFLI